MDLGIFTPPRPADDFNKLPDKRRGLFWDFMAPLLGLPDTRANTPARFLGLSADRYGIDWQLDAVRRRDERMRQLNLPPTRGEVVVGIVGDVVEAVRRLTKTDRAKAWLAERLQHGPVDATAIEAEGRDAGFTLKLLKVVKKRLRVVSVRKGANNWRWRLPTVKESKADGA